MEPTDGSQSAKRLELVIAGAAVVAAVVLASPWQMVDADALSRLAIGRTIVTTGSVPATDPFTFTAPAKRWGNPEWLGDTLIYLVHSHGGGRAAQVYKLSFIVAGMALVWILALRMGAGPAIAAAVLLMLLPGCAARFTLRNQIHAFWLVPAYGLLLHAAWSHRRWLWGLVPLGVLWANLHASFPLGWVVLLAAMVQALVQRRHDLWPWILALLVLHPALALLGPQGPYSYQQGLDHLSGGSIYRELIMEWRSTDTAPSRLAALPLHLMGLFGLASFLPARNRMQVGPLLLLLAGLVLASSSRRFLPLLVVLALPAVAANFTRLLDSVSRRWIRRVAMICIAVLGLGMAAVVAVAARTDDRPPLMGRVDAPLAAARFLANDAPSGARLFNPYNSGPWLLWLVGPRIQIYIDPRNNHGAALLQRYVRDLLPHPHRFEQEASRLMIALCLVDLGDGRYGPLAAHLALARRRWRMIQIDGRFALYARAQSAMAQKWGYHALRGELGFEYLAQAPPQALRHDLLRVRRQAPALAQAIEGYRLLCLDAPPPAVATAVVPLARRRAGRARRLLEHSLPRLPPSPALMVYLATAMARTGDRPAAQQVLQTARRMFPRAAMVHGLAEEMGLRSRGR